MKSLVTFGTLLLFSLLSMSRGQGYVRLSRADPVMSLLLSASDRGNFGFRENGGNVLAGNNAARNSIMKRSDEARKNFFDFIFRKFQDDEDGTDTIKKRNVHYRMLRGDPATYFGSRY